MVKGPTAKQMADLIFDEREILGMKGHEKLSLVVKV